MPQEQKPQIKIGDTFTVIQYSDITQTFYTDLDYEVTQGPTIEQLVSKLRWQGKEVKLINREDDGRMNVCFIFARDPDSPNSEDVWMVEDHEAAELKVKFLMPKHPHLQGWRIEPARIDVASWRHHRQVRGLDRLTD